MKHCKWGVALLVLLLLIGALATENMRARHEPITAALDAAADSAQLGQWEAAVADEAEARQAWQDGWTRDAALCDHAPMEEIDALFARTAVYAEERDAAEFAASCRELSRLVDAMTAAHTVTWWNLL